MSSEIYSNHTRTHLPLMI